MAVILRHNRGTFRKVEAVFAFDPDNGNALVLLVGGDGDPDADADKCLSEVTVNELEALDEKRQYVSVAEQLKKRADFILNRE